MFGVEDFAWLDAQRRRFFPPERNFLDAHLTMFHALPPSVEQEAADLLKLLARRPRPVAEVSGLISLGRGVAYAIHSPTLVEIRTLIADRFAGSLTAQDSNRWRPHVTIQNKVALAVARDLTTTLKTQFEPRPLAISGLALNRYVGGPWEPLGNWSFRG